MAVERREIEDNKKWDTKFCWELVSRRTKHKWLVNIKGGLISTVNKMTKNSDNDVDGIGETDDDDDDNFLKNSYLTKLLKN